MFSENTKLKRREEREKDVDFGFGGKTGHVFCLLICNPSFVILSL